MVGKFFGAVGMPAGSADGIMSPLRLANASEFEELTVLWAPPSGPKDPISADLWKFACVFVRFKFVLRVLCSECCVASVASGEIEVMEH